MFLFSCDENQDLNNQADDESIEAAENEAAIDEITDEVDEIVYSGTEYVNEGGRVAKSDENSPIHCATITHDIENKTITIDFGDGCDDWRGRRRSGKIIITYTDHLFVPGAVVTITFEDFYFRGVKVNGVRVISNISETLEDNLLFDITFDGEFTWGDGSVGSRNAHWIVERIRAANPINDEKHVDGDATGTTHTGVDYSVDITETIVFKRSCGPFNVFIPVEGIKVIMWGGKVKTIDYGDGECDRIVTITTNGVSEQKELRRRFQQQNGQ